MSEPQPPLPGADRADVSEYFAAHAQEIDRGQRDVRIGLRWLAERDLLGLGLTDGSAGQVAPIGGLIAQIAEQCMSSAFVLWCQRMVLEYVVQTTAPFPRQPILARLLSADLLGSTALGMAMAQVVMGRPLSVRYRLDGDALILDGRITWASNLTTEANAAITVTAATDGHGQRMVIAVPLDTPGVSVPSYPELLALQATRSSSVVLDQVRLDAHWVVADDLLACLARIRPRFLALQSSFCLGLSRTAVNNILQESADARGVFDEEIGRLVHQLAVLQERLDQQLRQPDTAQVPMRDFIQTRLDLSLLAQAATRLELTLRGGRAYRLDDAAGRRFREAAFLPIQAPTEGQLRWELARAAA